MLIRASVREEPWNSRHDGDVQNPSVYEKHLRKEFKRRGTAILKCHLPRKKIVFSGQTSSELRRRPLTAQHQTNAVCRCQWRVFRLRHTWIPDVMGSEFDEERETVNKHSRVMSAVKRMPRVLYERLRTLQWVVKDVGVSSSFFLLQM